MLLILGKLVEVRNSSTEDLVDVDDHAFALEEMASTRMDPVHEVLLGQIFSIIPTSYVLAKCEHGLKFHAFVLVLQTNFIV